MKKTQVAQGAAYDVIVVAGQSNAEGCGAGPARRPFEPDGHIWMMLRKENKFSRLKVTEPAERLWRVQRAHMILGPAGVAQITIPTSYRHWT